MSKIADLLDELSRNDVKQPCYNGVRKEETEIAYQRILDKLFNDAVVELLSVSFDKNLLIKRLGEIQESQSRFYCPSKEEIKGRRDEEKQSKSESLKQETDYLEFMMKCVMLQRHYLSRFREYLSDNNIQEAVEPEPEPTESSLKSKEKGKEDANLIKGVKGLAKYLRCGTTKAQDIINNNEEAFRKAGVAMRVGKGWRFNKEKLDELIKSNPTALS